MYIPDNSCSNYFDIAKTEYAHVIYILEEVKLIGIRGQKLGTEYMWFTVVLRRFHPVSIYPLEDIKSPPAAIIT